MKWMPVFLVLLTTDPSLIGTINRLKREAKNEYESGNYQRAASTYRYLVDSLNVDEPEVTLNLANALFQMGDSTARDYYQSIARAGNGVIRSRAHQQLGVLANRGSKFEQALSHFKEAIKADPANDAARYNYEMVKKKLDQEKEDEKQQKQDQQQNQQDKQQERKQDQGDPSKQDADKSGEKKDQPSQQQANQNKEDGQSQDSDQQQQLEKRDLDEKLKEMNMSEEKARMILEAMRNQEIQYLQQKKRKSTMPQGSGRPDW